MRQHHIIFLFLPVWEINYLPNSTLRQSITITSGPFWWRRCIFFYKDSLVGEWTLKKKGNFWQHTIMCACIVHQQHHIHIHIHCLGTTNSKEDLLNMGGGGGLVPKMEDVLWLETKIKVFNNRQRFHTSDISKNGNLCDFHNQ